MDSTLDHEELARADEQLARLDEQFSKLGLHTARQASFSQTRASTSHSASWARRGFAGLLVAASVGVAAVALWRPSHNDAATTVLPQPAPQAQTPPEHVAPTAVSPELTQLIQSMAHDLATSGQEEIEGLKTSQEQAARDNARIAEQLKANQEQMTRDIAKVSEQLMTNQEQIARNNANLAEQLKASHEQMARDIAKVSEQNPSPRIPVPPPRPTVTPTRKPVSTLPSLQATAKPQAKKPQPSPTPVQSTPAR